MTLLSLLIGRRGLCLKRTESSLMVHCTHKKIQVIEKGNTEILQGDEKIP